MKRLKKHWKKIIIIALALLALFYGACVFLSYKAADIFNDVVAERQLFPGTVTVERLSASPTGRVYFEGLRWHDVDGNLLADIPAGSFQVSTWDVVMRRIGTTTLKELTIEEGCYFHLYFNEDMELLNIKNPKERKKKKKKDPSDKKKNDTLVQITGLKGNKKFICKLNIKDGKIEAEAPGRHFTINHVDLRADVNTGKKTKLDLAAEHFDGTVEADELRIGGTLDFTPDMPTYDLYLAIKDCNPKSLDVGLDIDDFASVYANISGDLPHPLIEGRLEMEQLDITALKFTNLKGGFRYQDGKLSAEDVTADVYGGHVTAWGNFDLDGKSYETHLHGEELKGGIAAHDSQLKCSVTLNLNMAENRLTRTRTIDGDFYSGKGRYHFIPFEKISGSFSQSGRTITFNNVVITIGVGDITTDAFSIVHGKVHLGKIYLGGKEVWQPK